MRIRVRVALMGPEGSSVKETDLEIKEGLSLGRFLRKADKLAGLKEPAFKPFLKGRLKAGLLLNGDRVEPDQTGTIVLRQGDEISLLSGMAGG